MLVALRGLVGGSLERSVRSSRKRVNNMRLLSLAIVACIAAGCASEKEDSTTQETAEVTVTDVVVSSASCNGSITLRALVANDSPFGGVADVAFYYSTSKALIGVMRNVEIPPVDAEPPFAQVDIVWNNPAPGSALVTVVADDDGTGQGKIPETNETDNAISTTLTTCPSP